MAANIHPAATPSQTEYLPTDTSLASIATANRRGLTTAADGRPDQNKTNTSTPQAYPDEYHSLASGVVALAVAYWLYKAVF